MTALARPSAGMESHLTMSADIGEQEWNAYVERHPDATADHLWRWRTVFDGVFSQQSVYLAVRRNGVVTGVLPLVKFRSLLFGRFIVSVPYLNYGGLIASDPESADTLVECATSIGEEFGASYVELRHQHRLLPAAPVRAHKVRMVLDLPATAEDLWKGVDRKVRNQIRKAQKEGLIAEDGALSLIDDFYPVFARNMRDLGTPVYSRRVFAETVRSFENRARVHVVRHNGRAIAGAVTIRFRDSVIVPWASSLREFRHLCPNMLLYWAMLERATTDGLRLFDFGRSTRGGGTHSFKQQWGAREIPLHWEYILLKRADAPDHGPEGSRFDAAIAAWQRLPLWLTNRVGPRIVRNIP